MNEFKLELNQTQLSVYTYYAAMKYNTKLTQQGVCTAKHAQREPSATVLQ